MAFVFFSFASLIESREKNIPKVEIPGSDCRRCHRCRCHWSLSLVVVVVVVVVVIVVVVVVVVVAVVTNDKL